MNGRHAIRGVAFGSVLSFGLLSQAVAQIPDQRVVLVHGFASSPDTWSDLVSSWPAAEPFINADDLLTPGTSSLATFSQQANELDQQIPHEPSGWVMVSHSGGGPVSRRFTRDHAADRRVRSLITIAGANQGAPLAANAASAGVVLGQLANSLARGPCGALSLIFPHTLCRIDDDLDDVLDAQNLLVAVLGELADQAIPLVLGAMGDLRPGSSALEALTNTPEPIRTAAITIVDTPEAEAFKVLTPFTGWSEDKAEDVFNAASTWYFGVSAAAGTVCAAQGIESRWCIVAGQFLEGYTALILSDDRWRTQVNGGNPAAPADGIIPQANQFIPSPASPGNFVKNFTLQEEIFHLHQTRSDFVRDEVSRLLEDEDLAVFPAWHEMNPAVNFTGQVNGQTLLVNASSTTNPGAAVLEYRWDWGDGTSSDWSTSVTASHSYPDLQASETYAVRLDVREQGVGVVLSRTKSFTVSPDPETLPVASVTMAIATTIPVGEVVRVVATVRAQDGTVLPDRPVSWSRSNTRISITPVGDQSADIEALAEGTVTLTATSEGVSDTETLTVTAPVVNDASAGNNSFPAAMAQGQFYAVSVVMTNSGGTTWRDSDGYFLSRVSGGFDWIPGSVGMGPYSTTPGATKTFQFNLYNEGVVDQVYDVFYRMYQSGAGAFGDQNGRQITVLDPSTCTKNCGPSALISSGDGAVPNGASGSGLLGASSSGEVIQTIVVDDYPLHFVQENDQQVAYIRYFAALTEAWPVDVEFDITFDSKSVSRGQIKKGLKASNYEVEVEQEGADRVKIKLKRVDVNAALTGEGLVLEIPIVAKPNQPLQPSLTQLVLTVSR